MWKVVVLALCMFVANRANAAEPPSPVSSASNTPNNQQQPSAAPAITPDTTVLLRVSVIELSTTKLRRLGMDFSSVAASNTAATVKPQPADKDVALFSDWSPKSTGCLLVKEDDTRISVIKALVADHLAKIVAQPVLVTMNGRAASFNSGGEIPVPVTQSAGMVTIEWKRHGLQIDFVPVVQDKETLRLELRTRLSVLDQSQSIKIGGTTIPGIMLLTDMDTAFKIKTDQVAVVCGGTRAFAVHEPAASVKEKKESKPEANADASAETSEEVAILVLIKPEIVEPEK